MRPPLAASDGPGSAVSTIANTNGIARAEVTRLNQQCLGANAGSFNKAEI